MSSEPHVSSTKDSTLFPQRWNRERKIKSTVETIPHHRPKGALPDWIKTQTSQVDSTSMKDSITSSGDISETGSKKN